MNILCGAGVKLIKAGCRVSTLSPSHTPSLSPPHPIPFFCVFVTGFHMVAQVGL